MPLTPEREHELAVMVAAREANEAVKVSLPIDALRIVRDFDDVASMPEDDRQALYQRITRLVRMAHVIVTFPELYVGKGDGEPADIDAGTDG